MPGVGVKIALVDRAEGVVFFIVSSCGQMEFVPLFVFLAGIVAGCVAVRAMVARIIHSWIIPFLSVKVYHQILTVRCLREYLPSQFQYNQVRGPSRTSSRFHLGRHASSKTPILWG